MLSPSSAPRVLVIVPLLNEAGLIAAKLANLGQFTYPADRRHIVLVDGGSTDGTVEYIDRWVAVRTGFSALRTTLRNKTTQIAAALAQHPATEWILVTDADALLPADILEQLVMVACSDDSVGVVGTPVRPRHAHALERLHWRLADWLRERESHAGCAAIVAAPCYLAQRSLVADMPADTIADDVHVACRAMAAGRRVGFQKSALVIEMRSPTTVVRLFGHKYRKAGAYLREIFRFLPQIRRMPMPIRLVFLWRAVVIVTGPIAAVALSGAVLSAMWTAAWGPSHALGAAAVLATAAWKRGRDSYQVAALGVLLVCATVVALFTYPFSRQTASFSKVLGPSELQIAGNAE